METFQPLFGCFVDSYDSASIIKNYSPFESLPEYIDAIQCYSDYFGGDLRLQATFDRLHQQAKLKLQIFPNAKLIKHSTQQAFQLFKIHHRFDYIYLDANHQYEFVLRDLMEFSTLLSPNGFMQLNDCVLSPEGIKQNLGVLSALHQFIARSNDFVVLAQTCGNWADIIISRKNQLSTNAFQQIIRSTNLPYIEIPQDLAFNSKYVNGRMSYIL
jgi:hypothetical protein